jgi:flagellar biosynthesis protein FlhF
MHEALGMVRRDLGPDAAVLHTRRLRGGLLGWLGGGHGVEVAASASVEVPSRFAKTAPPNPDHGADGGSGVPPADEQDFRSRFRATLENHSRQPHSLVEQYSLSGKRPAEDLSESLFNLYADLIDAEIGEDVARELVDRVRSGPGGGDEKDPALLRARVAQLIEDEISVCGPIVCTSGKPRIVALVGPTGVGKTTTIAKLAANYRLREKRRVGLITVDTYRIAAVEQLRTYADIIDLPMEVVATPREMREAVGRLSGLDLILMDTAGRSPRDEVKIQELKSVLAEARADEVHLVLSCIASPNSLVKTAERFAAAGTTSLVLTKLDEAAALGNILPLVRGSGLPLSYVTNGQNVPDDIEPAHRRRLAQMILGIAR